VVGSCGLIPFFSSVIGSVIASTTKRRIELHTKEKPNLLHASSVSDQGSNVKLSGRLLTGEDNQEDCFNHNLHMCIKEVLGAQPGVIGSAVQASKDFVTMMSVVTMIRGCGTLRLSLEESQKESDDFSHNLTVVSENVTRWDGKYKALKRFIQIGKSIQLVYKMEKRQFDQNFKDLGQNYVKDPLTENYFMRLQQYEKIHIVTKYSQDKKLPTGSSVPYWTSLLISHTTRYSTDSQNEIDFKISLKNAYERRILKYTTAVTNFLKGALFDTRYSGNLVEYAISQDVIGKN